MGFITQVHCRKSLGAKGSDPPEKLAGDRKPTEKCGLEENHPFLWGVWLADSFSGSFRGQAGFCRFRECNLSEKLTPFLQSGVPKREFFFTPPRIMVENGVVTILLEILYTHFFHEKTDKKPMDFGKKLCGPHLFQQLWDIANGWMPGPQGLVPDGEIVLPSMEIVTSKCAPDGMDGDGWWVPVVGVKHVPRFLSIRYGWDWYILTVHLWV